MLRYVEVKSFLGHVCCMLQKLRLEEALKEVANSSGRTVLVPQRARGALKSWPAERSLLHQSAAALCEAIMVQGPQHLRRSWVPGRCCLSMGCTVDTLHLRIAMGCHGRHAQAWNEALQKRQARGLEQGKRVPAHPNQMDVVKIWHPTKKLYPAQMFN